MASKTGGHRVSVQVAHHATLQVAGLTAVVTQESLEGMKVFITRMLEEAGKHADEERLHVLAAGALNVGASEQAFQWLQSDIEACTAAAEKQERATEPAPEPLGCQTEPLGCLGADAHMPKEKKRRQDMRYWLFDAAYMGCLPCAVRFIEQQGVSPDHTSLSQGYSALDWALWGEMEGNA